jgi:hypothetical protein
MGTHPVIINDLCRSMYYRRADTDRYSQGRRWRNLGGQDGGNRDGGIAVVSHALSGLTTLGYVARGQQ